jgi:hypothetical protein
MALVGFIAGSEVPVVGNLVGLGVGLLAYFVTDLAVGEDVEQGIRESMGEQGCVRESPSSSSSTLTYNPLLRCFAGDTEITMADGSRWRIEDVQVGDLVASYDAAEGKLVAMPVLAVHQGPAQDMLHFQIDNGAGVYVTPAHELNAGDRWRAAGSIRPGDVLRVIDENQAVVDCFVERVEATAPRGPVYDLTVAQTHTYFAGTVLAHNKI